jgi:hypothetical protein
MYIAPGKQAIRQTADKQGRVDRRFRQGWPPPEKAMWHSDSAGRNPPSLHRKSCPGANQSG